MKIRTKNTNTIRRGGLVIVFLFSFFLGWGQTEKNQEWALKSIQDAQKLIDQHKYEHALELLNEVVQITAEQDLPQEKAFALYYSGEVFDKQGSHEQAIQSYLHASILFETNSRTNDAISSYANIGHLYFQQKAYTKAAEYYALAIKNINENSDQKRRLLLNRATALELRNLVGQAITSFKQLAKLYKDAGLVAPWIETQIKLSQLYVEQDDFSSALAAVEETKDDPSISSQLQFKLHLAKIFIFTRSKKFDQSLQEAKEAQKHLTLIRDRKDLRTFYQNVGVIYANLNDHAMARSYFDQALELAQKHKDKEAIAAAYNYTAADYYLSNSTSKALETLNLAIRNGLDAKAWKELETSYYIQQLLYQKNNLQNRAAEAQENMEKVLPKIEADSIEKKNELDEIEARAAQNDRLIREQIAQREQEARSLRQLKIEAERREKDLQLLKQNQELQKAELDKQRLEKQRVRQMYALLQEKARADELQKNKEIQDLMLKQKEADELERKRQIELLEKDKAMNELKLEEEQRQKRYAFGIILLVVFILLLVIVALFSLRSRNRKIKHQNKKINEQKEELQQTAEELLQQREELEIKTNQLTFTNAQISASIRYARTIQASILPVVEQIENAFNSSFILFRPKDVVSGDFYWFFQPPKIENERYIAVVDCTGHGVPGAFMSLIGSRILNELIINDGLSDIGLVLQRLDETVRQSLKQEQTENKDGMDVAFCRIKYLPDNKAKVYYAGAKRTLVLHNTESNSIEQVKGSRRSIGGSKYKGKSIFEETVIELAQGSTLYLTSDGYVDQNGMDRRKIGTPKFLELLEEIKSEPLDKQLSVLEETLDQHQGEQEQRDDITVLGIRL